MKVCGLVSAKEHIRASLAIVLFVLMATNLGAFFGAQWAFELSDWFQDIFGMNGHGGLWGFLQIFVIPLVLAVATFGTRNRQGKQ